MKDLPPLGGLSSEEKDALIQELWARVQALESAVERRNGKGVKKTHAIRVCRLQRDLSPTQRVPSPGSASERQAWVVRVVDEN